LLPPISRHELGLVYSSNDFATANDAAKFADSMLTHDMQNPERANMYKFGVGALRRKHGKAQNGRTLGRWRIGASDLGVELAHNPDVVCNITS
jgi:hypothetical protein